MGRRLFWSLAALLCGLALLGGCGSSEKRNGSTSGAAGVSGVGGSGGATCQPHACWCSDGTMATAPCLSNGQLGQCPCSVSDAGADADAATACTPWDGGTPADAATGAEGGTPEGGASDGGAPIALADFRADIEGVACDMMFRCPLPYVAHQGMPPSVLLRDPAHCREVVASYIHPAGFNDLATAVGMGLVRYDGAAARTCVDTLDQHCLMQPHGWLLDQPACRAVFQGMLPEGACCCSHSECAGDSYCAKGACRPRLKVGAACDEFSGPPCVRGAACRQSGSSYLCVARELLPEANEGEPCGLVDSNGAVEHWANCAAGLWCTSRDGRGVCRQPIAAGDPCGVTQTQDPYTAGISHEVIDQCEWGTFCEGSICTDDSVVLSNVAGDPCDLDKSKTTDMRQCNWSFGLTCSCHMGGCYGTCQQNFTLGGAEGAPCAGANPEDRLACDGDLTCSSGKQCIPFKPNGASCTDAIECASGDCQGSCVRSCYPWYVPRDILYD